MLQKPLPKLVFVFKAKHNPPAGQVEVKARVLVPRAQVSDLFTGYSDYNRKRKEQQRLVHGADVEMQQDGGTQQQQQQQQTKVRSNAAMLNGSSSSMPAKGKCSTRGARTLVNIKVGKGMECHALNCVILLVAGMGVEWHGRWVMFFVERSKCQLFSVGLCLLLLVLPAFVSPVILSNHSLVLPRFCFIKQCYVNSMAAWVVLVSGEIKSRWFSQTHIGCCTMCA